MSVRHLRAWWDADPFRPFTIRLSDGRTHRVPGRDSLSLSPGGRRAIVFRPDESFSLIDVSLVAGLVADGDSSHEEGP